MTPYNGTLKALLDVKANMAESYENFFTTTLSMLTVRRRRSMIKDTLRSGEVVTTMPAFPTFGLQPNHSHTIISESAPAYALSRENLRARRQRDWNIQVPVFPPVYTPSTSSILIDDFVYGATQCCMQVTMQAINMNEARQLYDQLIPLSPIMLALTAATPIYKSKLVNTDMRWNVLSHVFDDRNPKELATDQRARSRWSSNQTYLSQSAPTTNSSPNDDLPIHSQILNALHSAGMDTPMSRHFAHILRHDPVKLMSSYISDTDDSTNLFGLFNNSCYQGVRFKPPPGGANPNNIG